MSAEQDKLYVTVGREGARLHASVAARLLLYLVALYRRHISPVKPRTCRFYPTCSAYAMEAISRYGAIKGGWLALWRILRCHPFHPGGHDPVH